MLLNIFFIDLINYIYCSYISFFIIGTSQSNVYQTSLASFITTSTLLSEEESHIYKKLKTEADFYSELLKIHTKSAMFISIKYNQIKNPKVRSDKTKLRKMIDLHNMQPLEYINELRFCWLVEKGFGEKNVLLMYSVFYR